MHALYISIPFYQDLPNSLNQNNLILTNNNLNLYFDVLMKELKKVDKHLSSIISIYVGGGDPLLLSNEQLKELLRPLKNLNLIEFTFEIDPSTITYEKALLLKKSNVNRLSLKVDTFNNDLLKVLGKKYTYDDVIKTTKMLKELKFNNINIDLKFNIPSQTISMLKADLRKLKRFNFNHVSYYDLDIEADSKLDQVKREGNVNKMYEVVLNDLKKQGYEHYELVHFAKRKKYALQNILYWNLEDYLGIGLGAHSFVNNYRFSNSNNLDDYLNSIKEEKVLQNQNDNINLYIINSLSQLKGLNIVDFKNKYKVDILKNYKDINKYIEAGYLSFKNDVLKLTTKGLLYSSSIFEVFI